MIKWLIEKLELFKKNNHRWCMKHDKLYKEVWREWQRDTSKYLTAFQKHMIKVRKILNDTRNIKPTPPPARIVRG